MREDGNINEAGLRVGRNAQLTFLQPMASIQQLLP